jgi:hypothetical protein
MEGGRKRRGEGAQVFLWEKLNSLGIVHLFPGEI